MSKETKIRIECCEIWNNLKDKTKMIDYLIESKKQIADLEAKLAESEECRDFNAEMWTRFANKCKDLTKQLAEKEKERHEEWKTGKEWKWAWQKERNNKISFAVEQLEKAKGKIQHNILFVNCDDYVNVIEEIDNQIKQLKEQEKDGN